MWPITERLCSAKPRPVEYRSSVFVCERLSENSADCRDAVSGRTGRRDPLLLWRNFNASENNRKAQWTNDNIRIEFIRRNRWDRSVNVTCQTGVLWQVCVSGVHRPHAHIHIHTLYRFNTQWQMICFVVFSSIKRPWMVVIIWWSV